MKASQDYIINRPLWN